ncbi:MAG: PAS domain S-box protein [Cytophagales bacterium]|nr:MAG: PAS domain S-box protein [Cytophagales bacterium]
MNNRRQSIRTWVLLFFAVNIALVVINYVWTLVSNNTSLQDGRYVEISQENEHFIQRLSLITNSIIKGDTELKDVLKKNIEKYTINLSALKNGGQVVVGNEIINIEASSGDVMNKIEEIERTWNDLKAQLLIIIQEPLEIDSVVIQRNNITVLTDSIVKEKDSLKNVQNDIEINTVKINNPRVQKAYVYAQANLDDILNKSLDLNNIYENKFEESQSYQQSVLLVTVSLNLFLLFFGMFFIIRQIINPLSRIAKTAKDVAEGDVNSSVSYTSNNEIGDLSDSLNLLVTNFKQYAEFATSIGKGNFDIPFDVKSEKDTLGYSLLDMRNSLATVAEEDRKRNWANEGFTLFSDILRHTEKEINDLCYDIVSNLVKYTQANQGGLFLTYNDWEAGVQYLELRAAFAYNKRKYEEKHILIGQGLLGQAVLEKEISYINKIPDDYIKITSGLGDARPNVLLIIPLLLNDEIFGAIEIASFKNYEQYEIDFLKKTAENIASTIASVRATENTKRLLKEAEENSEKLKAQEEAMRQSMEELAATQNEMMKNQNILEEYKLKLEEQVEKRTQELKEKEKELFNTLTQLEEIMESTKSGIVALDKSFTVMATNTRMRQIMKHYFNAELKKGMLWYEIFQAEEEKIASQKRWERAFKGEDFNTEIVYIDSEGNKDWFEASYSPIEAPNGEIIGASMFSRNITRRKQSQKEIERTAKILDNSTNEVYLFSAENYQFISANERARKSIGYSAEELKEMMFFVLERKFDEDSFEAFIQPLKEQKTQNLVYETAFQKKEGSFYEVEVNLQLFDDEDKPLFAAIVQDISQRKQNEQQLKEAITRFDLVSRSTKEGLWEMPIYNEEYLNPENEFWFSKQFKNLLGYDIEDDFPNRFDSWSSLLHPEDKEKVLSDFEKHIIDRTGKTPFQTEYRLLTKQGDYSWFATNGDTLRDEKGYPKRVAGSIRDISRRKRAEQNLLEQMAQNEAILNAAVNSIIAIDMKGRILSVNKATLTMFGYSEAELIGKNIKMLMAEPHYSQHDRYLKNYHETGNKKIIGRNREEVAKRKDGSLIPIEISVSEGNVGNRKFYIGMLRDISERKIAEREASENQMRFKKIAEATTDAIILHSEGIITEVNERFLQMLGYQHDEVINKELRSFLTQESQAILKEKIGQNTEDTYQVALVKQNGETILAMFNPRNITLETEKRERVVSIREITDAEALARKNAEIELQAVLYNLQKAEQVANDTLNNLPGAVYRYKNDPEKTIIYLSDGIEELSGYAKADFMQNGKSITDLIVPQFLEPTRIEIQKALEEKKHYLINYQIKDKKGKTIEVSEKGYGIFDKHTQELLFIEGFIFRKS